ncbi:hypothetical protein GN277_20750 [Lachnospiraceae bacterium WCA-9-b2]|jgi:hypothetical protein|uniref:Uncharacterized protein n=1 Tax=Sporofaciens musculi TaxID=2681861 RepID=A0A7X3MK13_9FIRM|nr:hypothetical protein [Sporofaciens musculi]MXP77690.1 hypothetical protein [Sporofaciens musculi]
MGEGRIGAGFITVIVNRGFAGEKSRAITALRHMRLLFCSFAVNSEKGELVYV